MRDEWEIKTFGDLVTFVSEKSKVEGASIATYVSTENMLINFGGVTKASTLPSAGSVTCFIAGDTLFSNIRTYFKKVWQANFDGLCSNDVLVFRSKDENQLLPNYLHHLCRWEKFTEFSVRTSKGAKMPRGDKGALINFQVNLPLIPEQRAIAHILGTLDDKIELNRQMNKTLEEIARALFKSWFVDFDPVRAKMGKSEPYLPHEIWALFPDRLNDEDIPEGWCRTTLAEFASLNPESWSKKDAPIKIEYVDLANTKWGVIESAIHVSWTEAPSRAQRILRYGDTIIGMVRPGNGSYAFIGRDGLTASTGFAVLRPNKARFQELIFLAGTSKNNIERLAHLADGAAYPAVRPEVILATPIIVPKTNLQQSILDAFSKLTKVLLDSIELYKSNSLTVAAMRDALLPKLISGELRIKDIDRFIGGAT